MINPRSAAFLAFLGLAMQVLCVGSNAAESLADLDSYRAGCQSLSDGRYETAAEQFHATWDVLQESGSGDLERDFVASRLLEALVRNGDSNAAADWISWHPMVSPSAKTLRWAGIAFYEQERYSEAAEAFGALIAIRAPEDRNIILRYLSSLALSGSPEDALKFSEEHFEPESYSELLELSRIALLANRPSKALKQIEESEIEEREPGAKSLLATRIKIASLIQLRRRPAAIELAIEFIDHAGSSEQALIGFLLLEEARIDPEDKSLRSRLTTWSESENHPAAEAASFFLPVLFDSEQNVQHFLEETAVEKPPSPFSYEARLRLEERGITGGTDWLNNQAASNSLPGEPTRKNFSAGSAAYQQQNFEKAARLFLKQSREETGEGRFRADYNAAISSLQAGDLDSFRVTLQNLKKHNPKSPLIADLSYLGGLFLASQGDPEAFEELQSFIRDYPLHLSNIEARLALSEIHLNQAPARPQAARDIFEELQTQPLTLAQSERLDYTAVWVEQIDNNSSALTRLAREFVQDWPNSKYLPEAAMLLGVRHLESKNLESAREMFDLIVERFPNSPYADSARFFAIKSGPGGEETQAEWREIAASDSRFAAQAQHELSLLLLSMDLFDEARKELNALLETTADTSELRYAALADLGFSHYLEALSLEENEEQLEAAAAVFARLSNLPDLPATWRYNAAVRRAKCLEALGRPNIALEIYRSIIAEETGDSDILGSEVSLEENEWIFRAGFSAIRILKQNEDWAGAIKIADTLSNKEGPRAIDAANLAEQLRLKHWVWD